MEVVRRHKLRVAPEPGADIGNRGEVTAERGIAGGSAGDLDALNHPGRTPAEDLGELGGVELRSGGREAVGQALEVVVRHRKCRGWRIDGGNGGGGGWKSWLRFG